MNTMLILDALWLGALAWYMRTLMPSPIEVESSDVDEREG